MAQNAYSLLTTLGAQRIAAAMASETPLDLTHIAIGDGATVPSGGETALYHEVARKTISGQGIVGGASNTLYADIYLAAADGPYTIREAGLFDSTGALIAIARIDPPINKPVPSSGAVVEGSFRIQIAVASASAVNIVVDPTMSVALQRLSVLPWIPVVSTTTAAPPANPAVGDTYLVPTGATGSWAGHAGKIAEWTPAGWAKIVPRDGHGIGLPDARQFIRVGGNYIEAQTLRSLANVPIDGYLSSPPGSPAEGAQYLVAPAPSGAWAGRAGQIVRWIGGAFRYEVARAGRVVTEWSGSRLVTRYFDGTSWAEWLASTTAAGPIRLATIAEADAGIRDDVAVSPATLNKAKASYMAARAAPGVGGSTLTPSGIWSLLTGYGVVNTFFRGASTFSGGVLTIGAGDEGLWLLFLSLREDGLGTTGQAIRIVLNGVALASDGGQTANNGAIGHGGTSAGVALAIGDVLRFEVIQTTGADKLFDEYTLSAARAGGAT